MIFHLNHQNHLNPHHQNLHLHLHRPNLKINTQFCTKDKLFYILTIIINNFYEMNGHMAELLGLISFKVIILLVYFINCFPILIFTIIIIISFDYTVTYILSKIMPTPINYYQFLPDILCK